MGRVHGLYSAFVVQIYEFVPEKSVQLNDDRRAARTEAIYMFNTLSTVHKNVWKSLL